MDHQIITVLFMLYIVPNFLQLRVVAQCFSVIDY